MKQKYIPKIMCSALLADDKLRSFVGNARVVTGGSFRKIPRIKTKILPWIFFVQQIKFSLLLTDRKKMVLLVNNAHTLLGLECQENSSSRKYILPWGYLFLRVKSPSLLADHQQIHIVCKKNLRLVLGVGYHKNATNGKTRQCREVTIFNS